VNYKEVKTGQIDSSTFTDLVRMNC